MEPRLRHDFSSVRIHADESAAASARSVGALAYTVGSHVAFAGGRYRPGTPAGTMLIAHELAHVVQQRRGGSTESAGAGVLETAADRAMTIAARPYFASVSVDGASGVGLLRQTKDSAVTGIGQVKAMTPEDMYNKLIAMRGFDEAIPVGKLDGTRTQLARMEAQLKESPTPELQRQYNKLRAQYNISVPEAPGAPAGQGYNTYAIVQVIDKDGNIVAVADGKYTGALHAEQIALKKISEQLGDQQIPGARVEIVSDRTVCQDVCVPAFEDFAEKYDVGHVDAHVFRRPKAVGTGLASEKTTARTVTARVSEGMQTVKESKRIVSRASIPTPPASGSGGAVQARATATGRPRATVSGETGAEASPRSPVSGEAGAAGTRGARVGGEAEHEAEVPRATGVLRETEAGESVLGGAAKSAFKGAAISIGTGAVLYVLQELTREKVLADLAALPQPQPDPRSARAFLSDPTTQKSIRALDLVNKNLAPVGADLETQQKTIMASRFIQLMATAVLPEKTVDQYEKKIRQLDMIQDDVNAWEMELLTIDANLDALLDLEGQMKQTGKAARDLRDLFSRLFFADQLIKMGFSFEEYIELLDTLDGIAASTEKVVSDAHRTKETVRRLLDEAADFEHQVNRLWWQEFAGQVNKVAKDTDTADREAQRRSMTKTKVRYGSLEGLEPLPLWNSDQMGMWYHYKSRESEILFELNELTKSAPGSQGTLDRKITLETELADVRRRMLQMRSGSTATP